MADYFFFPTYVFFLPFFWLLIPLTVKPFIPDSVERSRLARNLKQTLEIPLCNHGLFRLRSSSNCSHVIWTKEQFHGCRDIDWPCPSFVPGQEPSFLYHVFHVKTIQECGQDRDDNMFKHIIKRSDFEEQQNLTVLQASKNSSSQGRFYFLSRITL